MEHQILDGHHRVKALCELGKTSARCLVWDVDDREALVLLATLNRLEGRDAPRKRAHLLGELSGRFDIDIDELATLTPERRDELDRLLTLNDPPPSPYEPVPLEQMPVAVHFFLLPAQKRSLNARLREMGGSREAALMELVGGGSQQPNEVNK